MAVAIIIVGCFDLIVWSIMLYNPYFKRFWDIVLSALGIIVLSPLMSVLTVLGAIKMKGNPFFVQLRPGKKDKDGKERFFKLIKFRSMTCEKDKDGNLLPDETRLTQYGKLLRSTSLDELPELLNILKGDMSIVGPRPQLIKDLLYMSDVIKKRHNIRPGLTGLAQVNGRNAITWEQKFNWDLKYISDISLWSDFKIVVLTMRKVLMHSESAEEIGVTCDYGDELLKNGLISDNEFYSLQVKALEIEGRHVND